MESAFQITYVNEECVNDNSISDSVTVEDGRHCNNYRDGPERRRWS